MSCNFRLLHLQIFDIDVGPGSNQISYDEEWLAITKKYNPALPLTVRSADFGFVFVFIHSSAPLSKESDKPIHL